MEIFGDTLMFGSVRSVPEDLDLSELEVKTGQDAIAVITEVMDRQRRELAERRAREEERCSELRHETIDGVTWEYVVVDGAFARIVDCELPDASMRELTVPSELDGLVVLELAPGACRAACGCGAHRLAPIASRRSVRRRSGHAATCAASFCHA